MCRIRLSSRNRRAAPRRRSSRCRCNPGCVPSGSEQWWTLPQPRFAHDGGKAARRERYRLMSVQDLPIRLVGKAQIAAARWSPSGQERGLLSSGSGRSSRRKILSLAAMPFIAMWKKEPSCRIGMKKSAASRMMSSAPAKRDMARAVLRRRQNDAQRRAAIGDRGP